MNNGLNFCRINMRAGPLCQILLLLLCLCLCFCQFCCCSSPWFFFFFFLNPLSGHWLGTDIWEVLQQEICYSTFKSMSLGKAIKAHAFIFFSLWIDSALCYFAYYVSFSFREAKARSQRSMTDDFLLSGKVLMESSKDFPGNKRQLNNSSSSITL